MISAYDIVSTKEFLSSRPLLPERELLVATLDRAVLDYYGSNEEIREEAGEWLFGQLEATQIFSFNWICEHLGLEAKEVRSQIQQLTFPKSVSQAHRWLRNKVQSQGTPLSPQSCERQAA